MRQPPSASDANAPNATNYDESKANVYPNLPDPLLLKNGQRVTTARACGGPAPSRDRRRLRTRNPRPRAAPICLRLTWQVVNTTPEKYGGVDVITKRLSGHVDNSAYPQIPVTIDLVLTTPAKASGPVPVLMELAFAKDFQRTINRPVSEAPSGAGATGMGSGLAAGARQGLGIRGALAHQLSGRRRIGIDRGHHRADEQRPAARAR